MRNYILKIIFILIAVQILFLTTIEPYIVELKNNFKGEFLREKVRSEISKAIKKDNIIQEQDRILLKKFFLKIKNELDL